MKTVKDLDENNGGDETHNILSGTPAVPPSILVSLDRRSTAREQQFPGGVGGLKAARPLGL